MDKPAYWVALSKVPGVGVRRFTQMIDYFGSPKVAWEAGTAELARVPGLPQAAAQALIETRSRLDPEQEFAELGRRGIKVLVVADPHYPANLKRIYDPPPVIYYRGEIKPEDDQAVAIVGSRRATAYGKTVAHRLGADLAESGVTVVSGMARGIDTQAHLGALDAGGRTIAVLGSGLDNIYPPENAGLMHRIEAAGAVLSEFALGTPPDAGNFPVRNRVISGLSLGTVVVEAGENSGALITCDFALEQGRDVYAVPGPVTSPASRGCHRLLKEGAKLVETVVDILEEYNIQPLFAGESRGTPAVSKEERSLLELLTAIPRHLDELIADTGQTAAEVTAALTFLELKGLIRQLPGKFYFRSSK